MIELRVKFPAHEMVIILNPHRIDYINDKVDRSWRDSNGKEYTIDSFSCTSDLSGFTRLPSISPLQGQPLINFANQVIKNQEIGILHTNDYNILVSPHQGPHNDVDENQVEVNRKLMADLLNATGHPRLLTRNLRMLNFELMRGTLRPGIFHGVAQAISEKGYSNEHLPTLIVIDLPKQYIQRVAEIFRREVPIEFVPENGISKNSSNVSKGHIESGSDPVVDVLKNHKRILFYPSSGNDFRSLLFTSPSYYSHLSDFDYKKMTIFPDLYVHTDYSNHYPNGFNTGDVLYSDNRTSITVVSSSLIMHTQGYVPDPKIVHFDPHPNQGKFYFIRIQVNSERFGMYERDLLYGIYENVDFLTNYILPFNIHLSHILTIRSGGGFTGSNVSMRFTDLYLGKLNTKYIITDSLGRDLEGYNLIKNRPALKKAFTSVENRPTAIQGLKEIKWSGYGIFPNQDDFIGDAFICRIHHF